MPTQYERLSEIYCKAETIKRKAEILMEHCQSSRNLVRGQPDSEQVDELLKNLDGMLYDLRDE